MPNYELGSAHICMVRAGTPPDVISKLTDWMSAASRSAELQAFLTANNLDNFFVVGAEATTYVAKEIEQWGNIARTAGLSPT